MGYNTATESTDQNSINLFVIVPATSTTSPSAVPEKTPQRQPVAGTSITMPAQQYPTQPQQSGNYGTPASGAVPTMVLPPVYPVNNTNAPYPLVGMATAPPPSYNGAEVAYDNQGYEKQRPDQGSFASKYWEGSWMRRSIFWIWWIFWIQSELNRNLRMKINPMSRRRLIIPVNHFPPIP